MKTHLRGGPCQMGRRGLFRRETDDREKITCANCAGAGRRRDPTGDTFGHLTALVSVGQALKRGDRMWRFRCICGQEVERNIAGVRRSLIDSTPSCGCRGKGVTQPPPEFPAISEPEQNQVVKFLDENIWNKRKADPDAVIHDPNIPLVRAEPLRVAGIKCPTCGGRHVHAWASGRRIPPCTGSPEDAYTLVCEDGTGSRYEPEQPTTEREWLELLGDNVRYLRQAIGLKQRELAWRSGVERTYIGSIERGASGSVSFAVIVRLATALGTDPPVLMTRRTDDSLAIMMDLLRTGEDSQALIQHAEAMF